MPASPSTARAINDRLALRLLQQQGPLTATQLKQLTGLSRPTVADLVERLTAAGLIAVVGESGEQRRGPNAKLYGIVADRAHLAALDVRTESVAVLVADLVGHVLAEASVPIDGGTGTGPAVDQAVGLVERVAKEAGADRLHTVGIGAPGLIDPVGGQLRDSAKLPAWHRRLAAALQERFPRARVDIENETNLAARAEQRDGAARDRDTFVLLWLDLGVGAAVVLDGRLRRGASGGAGEVGFLPVPGTSGLPSATDCAGGFHSLAAAAAVTELATAHGWTPPAAAAGGRGVGPVPDPVEGEGVPRAADREHGPVEHPDAAVVHGRAVSSGSDGVGGPSAPAPAADVVGGRGAAPVGEPVHGAAVPPAAGAVRAAGLVREAVRAEGAHPAAGRFLDALADRLAVGAAAVVSVLDPGCVVLAGEVGRAGGDALAARVQARLARMSPLVTEVRAGALGGGAVLRGALLTARDTAQDELFGPPDRSQGTVG
ncbi:ROK family transcriptional regulator [Streptomyces poriticola]|uniref:ROK family transcriptional regulator n=1 Tax=Streptomyces poriticola TaxID=3120506 RepID=UPI002FCDEF49